MHFTVSSRAETGRQRRFCGRLKEAPAPSFAAQGLCAGEEKMQKSPLRELLEKDAPSFR